MLYPITSDTLNNCRRDIKGHCLYTCSVTSESGGQVNKVSMFDKDMMFLVVFGLRGLKHEDEAQKALQCAYQLKTTLHNDINIITVSIGITSG